MRLEWLEDILAVVDTGSFSLAAERRFLTQSAFSRRIRQIEAHVGTELFDRSRKPVELHAVVTDEQDRLRELVEGLHQLQNALRSKARASGNRVVIAAQHAIATGIAPRLVAQLGAGDDVGIRLRSANRDECYTFLLARQADLALVYDARADPLPAAQSFVERLPLGSDTLAPFATAALARRLRAAPTGRNLPVVGYPGDVFLGRLLVRSVFATLGETMRPRIAAETALTFAALRLAQAGVGVAWLPRSLVDVPLEQGALVDLSEYLPTVPLEVVALRLADASNPAGARAWSILARSSVSEPPFPETEWRAGDNCRGKSAKKNHLTS